MATLSKSHNSYDDKILSNKKSEKTDVGVELAGFMKLLESVDENSTQAKLNETTMSDNNGGRITL